MVPYAISVGMVLSQSDSLRTFCLFTIWRCYCHCGSLQAVNLHVYISSKLLCFGCLVEFLGFMMSIGWFLSLFFFFCVGVSCVFSF